MAIPGPRMIWEFGEVGYDYSRCYLSTNGEGGDCNRKLDAKPIRWDYQQQPARRHLYDVYASIAKLRKDFPATFTTGSLSYSLNGAVKTLQLVSPDLSAVVVGNFDVNAGSGQVTFPQAGTWYEYFTNEKFTASGSAQVMNLGAGEYKFYINKDLKPVVPDPVPANYAVNIYPNPVTAASRIAYALPQSGNVSMEVYDMQGRRMAIFSAPGQPAGNRNVTFRQVLGGRALSAGVYTLKISLGSFEETRKIIIARH